MIQGQVTPDREAVVPIRLRGVQGQELEIDAVLDSGFTEWVALPATTIAALGFPFRGTMPMGLGDGSRIWMGIYDGLLLWEGQDRPVVIHEADECLIGMALLTGSRVVLEVVDGGLVTIEPLP
jgi:predicted aspartyl protease